MGPPGGLAGQASTALATISAGTATSPGSLSNKVSPELLRPVTDEITTIPPTLAPSRAAPPTAAIEPWLEPTSQTGTDYGGARLDARANPGLARLTEPAYDRR